jgi:hypothetical protein
MTDFFWFSKTLEMSSSSISDVCVRKLPLGIYGTLYETDMLIFINLE